MATFYILPASASLPARPTVAKVKGVDCSDTEAIGELRAGDFACGTGAAPVSDNSAGVTRYDKAALAANSSATQ